ncbi:MAG TPA: carboxypeptidase-like regulatory domain-containing protein, partial [Acidimicrobiales bacterium]|nr:carboxypeptidase-like regulatory domain-containing protein [Acidimicrobiales bacterium]
PNRRRLLIVILSLCLALAVAGAVIAWPAGKQSPPASQTITGIVVTSNGAPVAGAYVVLVAQTAGKGPFPQVGSSVTDRDGRWSFLAPAYSKLPRTVQADLKASDGLLTMMIWVTPKPSSADNLVNPMGMGLTSIYEGTGSPPYKSPFVPGPVRIVTNSDSSALPPNPTG